MNKEIVTIEPNKYYYIHNVMAGKNDLHYNLTNGIIEIGKPKFYGEKSRYQRLTKILTENINIYLNIGGKRIKLTNKETNCDILLEGLKYHDVILENLNDFPINCEIEYNNVQEQTTNPYIGYVGDKKIICLEGMIGFNEP